MVRFASVFWVCKLKVGVVLGRFDAGMFSSRNWPRLFGVEQLFYKDNSWEDNYSWQCWPRKSGLSHHDQSRQPFTAGCSIQVMARTVTRSSCEYSLIRAEEQPEEIARPAAPKLLNASPSPTSVLDSLHHFPWHLRFHASLHCENLHPVARKETMIGIPNRRDRILLIWVCVSLVVSLSDWSLSIIASRSVIRCPCVGRIHNRGWLPVSPNRGSLDFVLVDCSTSFFSNL